MLIYRTLWGGSDVKSLYDTLHAKLISLAGSNVSVDYPLLHQYLIDLIYGFKPLDANGHDYVDMGEAGKWATCNVGANYPPQPGLYFAWGETQGYTAEQVGFFRNFTWYDYKHGKGDRNHIKLAKYCYDSTCGYDGFTDNLTTLELADDAAHVHMGGDWRMPTSDEWVKLFELCNISPVNDYEGMGVEGLLFTLKTDSSKQLFFPYAGYCVGGEAHNFGSTYVWSSSLDTNSPFMGLGFCSDLQQPVPYYSIIRYRGISVRGILGVGE